MEIKDPKVKEINDLFNDYSDLLTSDYEIQIFALNLLARFLESGEDVTDEELDKLKAMAMAKINKYAKDKAH